ncbi:hypothetical protein ES288_A13G182800v1 [Gossypium darwinii]|uniref:Uncharacterized protein n=1 Tax=Gossypium darwinii TaxID=34276 RepID=A0A5D2E1F5_GOSDA|nr:hypothetical protein ES288_A13G182800v1 [Gossypium darwinii]
MVVTSFLRSSWRPYFLINCSLKMNLRLLKMIVDPQNIHRLKDSRFPLNILDKIVSGTISIMESCVTVSISISFFPPYFNEKHVA